MEDCTEIINEREQMEAMVYFHDQMADELRNQLWQTRNKSVSSERSDNVYCTDNKNKVTINYKLEIGYAITVNPDPFKFFNKRMYKNYTHEQQIKMLTRIENSFVKQHKVNRKYLYFEICPKSKMIHYHALYEMSDVVLNKMKEYFQDKVHRINGPSWRGFVSEIIYDEPGWIKYIRKDIV